MSEQNENSCRTIIHFLSEYVGEDPETRGKRIALIKDLCWRMTRLDPKKRALILSQACYVLLPSEVRLLFSVGELDVVNGLTEQTTNRERKDLAIITVIRPELCGVLRALGRRPNDPEDDRAGSFGYWFSDLTSASGKSLSIVVTMVGKPRNVPCAIAVSQLLNRFEVGLVMLVGIAAGVRAKTKLGDVVYAERVYDYEHKRLEVSHKLTWRERLLLPWRSPRHKKIRSVSAGIQSDVGSVPKTIQGQLIERDRPELWPVPSIVCEALERSDWRSVKDLYERLISEIEDSPDEARGLTPIVHDGTIAAGEKLIADGSLERMYESFDQRIRAGDQEDSGFAQAADFHKALWCIFRGICDYADPQKAGNWQSTAAISAAAAGMAFLQTVWVETNRRLIDKQNSSG